MGALIYMVGLVVVLMILGAVFGRAGWALQGLAVLLHILRMFVFAGVGIGVILYGCDMVMEEGKPPETAVLLVLGCFALMLVVGLATDPLLDYLERKGREAEQAARQQH